MHLFSKQLEKQFKKEDLDVVMFSINPAYDLKFGDYAIGEFDERKA